MAGRAVDVSGQALASGGRGLLWQIVTGLTEITNYLEDDWGDNALTSRSSTNDGVFAHPDANEAGDVLIGRYRPEWNTVTGSPSAANNQLELSTAQNNQITIGSHYTTGSIEFDFQFSAVTASDGNLAVSFMSQSNSVFDQQLDDSYAVAAFDGSSYDMRKVDSGSATRFIDSGWPADTSLYTAKGTRDSYGNFELLLDGSSKGTATDTTFTRSSWFGVGNDSESNTITIDVDNLVVK